MAPEVVAARAGMDESRLHRIEAGNDRMSVQELMQFADIFKVSASSFFEPARPLPRPSQPVDQAAGQPAGHLAGQPRAADRGGPERTNPAGRGASQAAQAGGASDGSAGGASDDSGAGAKNVAADTALAAEIIAQFSRIRDQSLREALVNLLQVSTHRG